MKTISFNKVWLTGNEKNYITQALSEGKTCGNGNFTHKCQSFFEEKLGSCKCLLTTSCTVTESKAIIETIKSKRVGVITAQHITAEVERRMIQTQLPQQSSG